MWIKSQDGTKLVDANQLIIEGNKIICCKWTLGEYGSKGRATQVLGEIQDQMEDKFSGRVFEMPER